MNKDIYGNKIDDLESSLKKHSEMNKTDYTNKMSLSEEMINTKGHPLQTYQRENERILEITKNLKNLINENKNYEEELKSLFDISIHYAEKGDIIYPLLKTKYQITGPNTVMWTEDDIIRAELKQADNSEKLLKVIEKIENMAKKEKNILFPICAVNFSTEEWHQIYREESGYDDAFGIKSEIWNEVKETIKAKPSYNGQIRMPSGELSVEELIALLNTIPMEITFVDKNNTNKYYNEGEKLFKRPQMSLGRKVYSCHPPKIEAMVKAIIDDFKSGKRSKVQIYNDKGGVKMCVTYLAVKNEKGEYLGTMELCQDMAFFKEDK